MLATNYDKADDRLLLLKLKEGSIEAFNALYEKHWDQVYSSAYARLKDDSGAKDITQDVFLQLWHRREELEIANLEGYFFIAVRNNVLKRMEKENRYTPISELLVQLKTSNDHAEAEVIRKEFTAAYNALVATLTPSQQEIFRMRYNQDFSTKEISEKLRISRKTVQNQLARSVAVLRHSLFLLYLLISIYLK